jgi:polyvinyl alcohol dehydrogenase (cytochrome)
LCYKHPMPSFKLRVALWLFPILLYAAPDGAGIYKKNCAGCHEAGLPRVPTPEGLKIFSPEAVNRSLVSGAMRFQGTYLTLAERHAVAEFVTGKKFEPATGPQGMCAGKPAKTLTGEWNGWGLDSDNSRFQSAAAAGLTAAQTPALKLKWAFGFPGDFVAFSQPSVVGGKLYVGSSGGSVYALDAASGCTHWSFDAGAGVRTAIVIGPGPIAYFGDLQANVYAIDANTGNQLWKTRVDDYPVARVTGTPTLYNGRLYVPVSSHEEWASADPTYVCCKFRGSVVALDAKTGKQVWKTYTIAETPHALDKKNKLGQPFWGPSGAGVWSSPTIDAKKNVLYVGTGDGYADPPTRTSDAILAMDLGTGKIVWSRQITEKDVFNTTCLIPPGLNCPDAPGPDFDFGSSPILRDIGGGKRALVIGQKSGVVHALDPDQQGEVLWQSRIGKGGVLGGIQWGPAADRDTVYVALSDFGLQISDPSRLQGQEGFGPDPNVGGGLFALSIATGERRWDTPSPGVGCKTKGCSPAQSAAVSAIPGVVFSGSLDGHLRAYSSKDGKILWDYDSVRDYETVNRVKAKGGSIDGPGPIVVGGMVFVNSGYGYFNAIPGNVLLAFSVDGH